MLKSTPTRWMRIGTATVTVLSLSLNSAGAWGWFRGGRNCSDLCTAICPPVDCTRCDPCSIVYCVEPCWVDTCDADCSVGLTGASMVVSECNPCITSESAPIESPIAQPTPVVPGEPLYAPLVDEGEGSAVLMPSPPHELPNAEPALRAEDAPTTAGADAPDAADLKMPPESATPAAGTAEQPDEQPADDTLFGDPGLSTDPDTSDRDSADAAPVEETPEMTDEQPTSDALPGTEETPEPDAAPDGLESFDFSDPATDAPPAASDDSPAVPDTNEGTEEDPLEGLGAGIAPATRPQLVSLQDRKLSTRFWSDATGQFHATGRLTDVGPASVRILKDNGHFATVPVSQLSRVDQAYVRALQFEVGQSWNVASR